MSGTVGADLPSLRRAATDLGTVGKDVNGLADTAASIGGDGGPPNTAAALAVLGQEWGPGLLRSASGIEGTSALASLTATLLDLAGN